MDILAINCGSSSVKYQLFDWEKKEIIAKVLCERVTIGGSFPINSARAWRRFLPGMVIRLRSPPSQRPRRRFHMP